MKSKAAYASYNITTGQMQNISSKSVSTSKKQANKWFQGRGETDVETRGRKMQKRMVSADRSRSNSPEERN